MLAEPNRTPYDLQFRLFGFPVRIHPLFWVLAALLGASALDAGLVYLLIWVGVVLVSILVHELGHALAFRWWGVDSHIVLYLFGGLAVPRADVPGRWRRIVISLAGPGAGFLLYGVVFGSNYFFPWAGPDTPLAIFLLYYWLVFVNLYWGILNLFPIYPLDGGRVSQEVCSYFSRRNGLRLALQISIGVAGFVALYSVASLLDARRGGELFGGLPGWVPRGTLWLAILFGMLAVQNYQLLQQIRWSGSHWDDGGDRPPWGR